MIIRIRAFASAAVLSAAAIGLAGPVSAAPPPDGIYVGTVTDNGGAQGYSVGNTEKMLLTSCGPDCIQAMGSGGSWSANLHPEGAVWSGSTNNGGKMWFDENTLAGGMDLTDGAHLKVQMTRA